MTSFLWLYLLFGPWRWWRGRGGDVWPVVLRKPDGGAKAITKYFQYVFAVAFAVLVALLAGSTWQIGLAKGFAVVALTALAGHTVMLFRPGEVSDERDADDRVEKLIYTLACTFDNAELRWWSFALLRYQLPAELIAAGLDQLGVPNAWLLTPATLLLIATYRVTAALEPMRSPFKPSRDDHVQYAEFFGWMWIGAAFALL